MARRRPRQPIGAGRAVRGAGWPAILPRGAVLLSALTFAAYVMGLVRDRTFARTFGAGSELDVYNAALILPELALDVLVVAGLSSAFVPVFARIRHDQARGRRSSAAPCSPCPSWS